MECKKCVLEIPNQFEFVLSKNMCPKCGNKLMTDGAMKVYIDLKKRLNEVEFVMDKSVVCERVAMFMINNYEVLPLGANGRKDAAPITTAAEKSVQNKEALDAFRAKLASLDEDPDMNEMSNEEIRAEEAARAEEIALAREVGMNVDIDPDEEIVTGLVDANKIQRLKKLAISGQMGLIKRSSP